VTLPPELEATRQSPHARFAKHVSPDPRDFRVSVACSPVQAVAKRTASTSGNSDKVGEARKQQRRPRLSGPGSVTRDDRFGRHPPV
jgi:hypothetical protein